MNIGETYRIHAIHNIGQYADIIIEKITDNTVTFKRLKDGEVVEVEKEWIEKRHIQRIDESEVYGHDCPRGVCDT